jgi:hypothetical protein
LRLRKALSAYQPEARDARRRSTVRAYKLLADAARRRVEGSFGIDLRGGAPKRHVVNP